MSMVATGAWLGWSAGIRRTSPWGQVRGAVEPRTNGPAGMHDMPGTLQEGHSATCESISVVASAGEPWLNNHPMSALRVRRASDIITRDRSPGTREGSTEILHVFVRSR